MLTTQEHLNIKHSKNHKSLKGLVKAVDFMNDGFYIVYIPSLKLSAYGKTLKEAGEMMQKVIIPDFCESLMELSLDRIVKEFKNLGWNSDAFFRKQLSKSSHVDVEGILRDFDLDENTKINERVLEVAA